MHPLKVSLEDLYNGASKKLSLSRDILCPKCKGYVINLTLSCNLPALNSSEIKQKVYFSYVNSLFLSLI